MIDGMGMRHDVSVGEYNKRKHEKVRSFSF